MYSNFLVILIQIPFLFQYLFKKGCVFCVPQNVHILPTQNPPPHREPSPWNRLLTTNLTSTMAPIWPFSPFTVLKALVTNSFRFHGQKKQSLRRLDQLVSFGLDKKTSLKYHLSILKLQFFVFVPLPISSPKLSCPSPHPPSHGCHPTNAGGSDWFTKKRDLPANNLHQRIGPFPWSLPAIKSCHGRTLSNAITPPPRSRK